MQEKRSLHLLGRSSATAVFKQRFEKSYEIRELSKVEEILDQGFVIIYEGRTLKAKAMDALLQLKKTHSYIYQLDLSDQEGVHYLLTLPEKNAETILDSFYENACLKKQKGEKEKQEEERFQSFSELLPQPFFEIDQEGKITSINKNGLNSTGYTEEDFLSGIHFSELLAPEELVSALKNIKKIALGETGIPNEYNLRKKDGTFIPVLIYSTPIIREGKYEGLRGIALDISARKEMERAIFREKIFTEHLLNRLPGLIYLCSESGKCIRWNHNIETILGYKADEIKGRTIHSFIAPEELEGAIKGFKEAFQTGQSNVEIQLYTKTGKRIPHFLSSRIIELEDERYLLGVGLDIRKRLKAEEQRHRYEFIINTVQDMMCMINSEYEYEAVNDQFCQILGRQRDELLKNKIGSNWNGEYQTSIKPYLDRCLKGEYIQFEKVLTFPNEKTFHSNISMYPYTDKSGEISHIILVIRDITTQKQFEKDLEESRQDAETANKAKSSFLANISHEIRTPMNAIMGFTQLMAKDSELKESHRRNLDTILENGKHLIEILHNILEIANIESGRTYLKEKELDLSQLLKQIEHDLQAECPKKGLKYTLHIENEVPQYMIADGDKIEKILRNIIDNGIKFTKKGHIRIRISGYRSGNIPFLNFYIQDTGIGISKEYQEYIFNSFGRTEYEIQTRNGTGLGLAISRNYARQICGDILVSSRKNVGSTFQFYFPYKESRNPENRTITKKRTKQTQVSKTSHTLLVMGIETEIVEVIDPLEKNGYRVNQAINPDELLRALSTIPPALILIDHRKSNDYKAIKEFLKKNQIKDLPIVLLTGDESYPGESGIKNVYYTHFNRMQQIIRHRIRQYQAVERKYEVKTEGTSGLDTELLSKIKIAAQTADYDELLSCIEKLKETQPELAEGFYQAADHFNYDEVIKQCTRYKK